MTASTDPLKASRPDSKPLPGQKPDARDELKSLPMTEVEKKLGFSPTASLKPKPPNGWYNTAPTRSRKRRPTNS